MIYYKPFLSTEPKVKNEDEIQNNIQETGDDQEKQRGLAVAQGHDHVGEQIEKHGRADAPGNDDDITVGVLHDLWRREHEYKHRA